MWPVWNRDAGRFRAPVRAVLPLVLTFLALAVVQTAIRTRFEHPAREPLELLGLSAILVAGVLVSARLVDRRPVSEYGLSLDRRWWKSFAVAGGVGTAVNAGALAVSVGAGWASVTGYVQSPGVLSFLPATAVTFALVAVAASWEEFVFRAAMLKNVAEGAESTLGRVPAVVVGVLLSSLVFAALHGGKVDDPTQYGYYLEAGLLFGTVYVLTGDLSLPVGFHVFYNYTQGLFGLGVSQATPELVALELVGPAAWVGEEGLVHVVFAAVGGALLVAYVRWRDGPLRVRDRLTRWTPTTARGGNSDDRREPSAE